MQKTKRIVIIVYLLALVMLNLGCSKDSLFPKADVLLTAGNINIIPSSSIATEIDESTINITLLTGVSCSVVGYDLTYETVIGDPIDNLAIYNISIEKNIKADKEGTSEDSFIVRPYTQRVMNLFKTTTSDISPIRAKVKVHFHDVNNNDFDKEVHFLCWKYQTTSE